jgi:EmrB/QacA subfamily drug resistance transporter
MVLAVCATGQFMVVLDGTIVNVALRPIQDALGFTTDGLQWVINAYTVVFAGFLLLGGRLADLFGRRRVFAFGIVTFTVASLVAGLAFDPVTLLVARGIQGFGGAVLAPATLTVLFTMFTDPATRAKAFGTWSAVAAGGAAVGALAGGVITQWVSWRWIFLVNVPIGVVLLVLLLLWIPESRPDGPTPRIDVIGAVSVTAGLVAVVYGMVEAQGTAALVAGILLLGVFLLNEARFARNPLVPLIIFGNRSVSAANLISFTTSAALLGVLFLSTLLIQFSYRYDALQTGLSYLPLSLAIVLTARGIVPRLITRWGPKPMLFFGSALVLGGVTWLAFAPEDGHFVNDVLGPLLLVGFGQGAVSSTVTVAGASGVDRSQAGLVSGLLNASRQVGGALWLGVLAAVATRLGYHWAFTVATVFPAIGVIAALAVPGRRRLAAPAAKAVSP